ncbi:MAG: hypothetical protein F4Z55_11120 [Boseongicola sp. SB0667_bin_21]|nr:hypothetical protein [Boseongicola sp. SB0667_bin_21]
MAMLSGQFRPILSSRRIASSDFRSSRPFPKQAAKTAGDAAVQVRPDGSGQPAAAVQEGRAIRCDGRRLGRLRGGRLRITCGCGHSGEVPVLALVARHGEETRVRDAVASMRCGRCGAQRVQEVRWQEAEDDDERGTK